MIIYNIHLFWRRTSKSASADIVAKKKVDSTLLKIQSEIYERFYLFRRIVYPFKQEVVKTYFSFLII